MELESKFRSQPPSPRQHLTAGVHRKCASAKMAMLHPVYGAPFLYFYPVGNTPATSLSQNLPPGVAAKCLLLGCGDPRNIFFTLFGEQNSGKTPLWDTVIDFQVLHVNSISHVATSSPPFLVIHRMKSMLICSTKCLAFLALTG
jgi:Domain of unknown function (DUF4470)